MNTCYYLMTSTFEAAWRRIQLPARCMKRDMKTRKSTKTREKSTKKTRQQREQSTKKALKITKKTQNKARKNTTKHKTEHEKSTKKHEQTRKNTKKGRKSTKKPRKSTKIHEIEQFSNHGSGLVEEFMQLLDSNSDIENFSAWKSVKRPWKKRSWSWNRREFREL